MDYPLLQFLWDEARYPMSVIAVSAIVQFLSHTLKIRLPDNYKGFRRLLFVLCATVILGTITLVLCGLGVLAAVVYSNVLAHSQVFFHQVYKEFNNETAKR